MKTERFFEDLKNKDNITVITKTDEDSRSSFEMNYRQFRDKFFYEQFMSCGGIIIENWIRLYGCGELNIVMKNSLYRKNNQVDILIGGDVLGGLFGLKDDIVFYYPPDTNEWESLDIYYTQFIYWLVYNHQGVEKFYELFRWNTWREDCRKLAINEGYSFYPVLQAECDIEKRSRKAIPIDELIRFHLGI